VSRDVEQSAWRGRCRHQKSSPLHQLKHFPLHVRHRRRRIQSPPWQPDLGGRPQSPVTSLPTTDPIEPPNEANPFTQCLGLSSSRQIPDNASSAGCCPASEIRSAIAARSLKPTVRSLPDHWSTGMKALHRHSRIRAPLSMLCGWPRRCSTLALVIRFLCGRHLANIPALVQRPSLPSTSWGHGRPIGLGVRRRTIRTATCLQASLETRSHKLRRLPEDLSWLQPTIFRTATPWRCRRSHRNGPKMEKGSLARASRLILAAPPTRAP